MQHVTGFMSSDGKFFSSDQACRLHEDRLAYQTGLASRSKILVDQCSSGVLFSEKGRASSLLPQYLLDYLGTISEDDFIDIWNEYLIHLFVDDDGPIYDKKPTGSLYEVPVPGEARESMDPWDFFVLKAEIAFRLLAFVLEKPL